MYPAKGEENSKCLLKAVSGSKPSVASIPQRRKIWFGSHRHALDQYDQYSCVDCPKS